MEKCGIRIAFILSNFLFIFSISNVHKSFSELNAKIIETAHANSTVREFSSFLVSSFFEMKAKRLLDTEKRVQIIADSCSLKSNFCLSSTKIH